jgi:arsenate reductase
MLVLGLQGSPRKKGNSSFLLSLFMQEVEKTGATTRIVDVTEKKIEPCIECNTCSRTGFCPFDDDMGNEIYSLIRAAEVVVMVSPVFFYGVTAQLKALIDRSQALWARRYHKQLLDPMHKIRSGFVLAIGATKGENLFEGINLTAKYFFDAIGASYKGTLGYRRIENRGDMEKHPTVNQDVADAVDKLLKPFAGRKTVLFACRENACRSQIAAAFAQLAAGDTINVLSGGSAPAETINQDMELVMAEKGIDMAFRKPASIEAAIKDNKPDIMITMGCGEECPFVPGAKYYDWDLPDPAGKPLEFMRDVRDRIEKMVEEFVSVHS